MAEALRSRAMVGRATFSTELSSISTTKTTDNPRIAGHTARSDVARAGAGASKTSVLMGGLLLFPAYLWNVVPPNQVWNGVPGMSRCVHGNEDASHRSA